MKVVFLIIILLGAGIFVMRSTMSSIDEGFNPTEQGRETHKIIESCANWTEVLDRAVPPQKWREASSSFDFNYRDLFDEEATREEIARKLENNKLSDGFSFFYRFTDAVTFAVNFDRKGNFNNIQNKEGMGALMDSTGG